MIEISGRIARSTRDAVVFRKMALKPLVRVKLSEGLIKGPPIEVFDDNWFKEALEKWVSKKQQSRPFVNFLVARGLHPLVILVELGKDLQTIFRHLARFFRSHAHLEKMKRGTLCFNLIQDKERLEDTDKASLMRIMLENLRASSSPKHWDDSF